MKTSGRPLGSNADEWHLFLAEYLDSRAASPDALAYVAMDISDAIVAAYDAGYNSGLLGGR